MYANVAFPAPVHLLRLQAMVTALAVLVWHIQKGQYSDTVLDGLNVLGIGSFTGNIWAGQAKDATLDSLLMRKPRNSSEMLCK